MLPALPSPTTCEPAGHPDQYELGHLKRGLAVRRNQGAIGKLHAVSGDGDVSAMVRLRRCGDGACVTREAARSRDGHIPCRSRRLSRAISWIGDGSVPILALLICCRWQGSACRHSS